MPMASKFNPRGHGSAVLQDGRKARETGPDSGGKWEFPVEACGDEVETQALDGREQDCRHAEIARGVDVDLLVVDEEGFVGAGVGLLLGGGIYRRWGGWHVG